MTRKLWHNFWVRHYGIGVGRILAESERPGIRHNPVGVLIRLGGRWGIIVIRPSHTKEPAQ